MGNLTMKLEYLALHLYNGVVLFKEVAPSTEAGSNSYKSSHICIRESGLSISIF